MACAPSVVQDIEDAIKALSGRGDGGLESERDVREAMAI
jgi:hypothetical protein